MVRKVITDSIFKAMRGSIPGVESSATSTDVFTSKEIISALASWAGKGKDEVIQIISREVGQAVAAMLKEPLAQAVEKCKLQVTLELVPRAKGDAKVTVGINKKTKTKRDGKKPATTARSKKTREV